MYRCCQWRNCKRQAYDWMLLLKPLSQRQLCNLKLLGHLYCIIFSSVVESIHFVIIRHHLVHAPIEKCTVFCMLQLVSYIVYPIYLCFAKHTNMHVIFIIFLVLGRQVKGFCPLQCVLVQRSVQTWLSRIWQYIDQVWGQDGWILAKFFFACLWTKTEFRFINSQEK